MGNSIHYKNHQHTKNSSKVEKQHSKKLSNNRFSSVIMNPINYENGHDETGNYEPYYL